ncbi:Gfo/Idh/MocA family oxidoreductase [Streptomyces sp. NPDC093228]|uniref:Gfo/Idh/MocA family protein n=1 Tax=Streptomyces sp. NPDC093228 TaxID=3155070 RepID=UPI003446BCF7
MTSTAAALGTSAFSMPTIGWGFLGAGHIATTNVGPAVHGLAGAQLRIAAGRNLERTAALGAARSTTDYAAVLEDASVDVVYIALHNSAHATWAIRALEAGKHVLCEKPLGVSSSEVRAMSRAAKVAGRLLVEAAWNRWHPRSRDLERLLKQGAVGEVRYVEAIFDGADPAPGNYRRDASLGGGALLDVGCYTVAAILTAYDWALPKLAAVHRETWSDGSAEVRTSASLLFDKGAAYVHASLTGLGREALAIYGTSGTLRMDHPFTAAREPVELLVGTSSGVESRRYAPVDPYTLMVAEVTRAVAGDHSTLLVPLGQSLAVAEVLDAIATSGRV